MMLYGKGFEILTNSDIVVSTVRGNQGTGSLFSAEILNSLIHTGKKTDETISNETISNEKQDDGICECGLKERNGNCPPVCPQH